MEEQGREAEAEAGSRQEEEGDKEAEPSRKGGRALNPSFSGRGRTFLPWREKGKVRTFVVVKFFYIVDQLLMRSLWLEKLTINDFAINSDFQTILLLKDQTNHYHVTHSKPHHFYFD